MQPALGPHLEETELELYSMGKLPDQQVQPFEEHFLACETCQDRLLEMEAYVNAIRSVSPKLREAGPAWWVRSGYIVAVLCGVAALLLLLKPPEAPREAQLIELRASRADAPVVSAAAGRPLRLRVDLTEVAGESGYRVEVVDGAGRIEARGELVSGDYLSAGLPAGQHFVRLFGDGGRLLREFAVRLE